MGGLDPAAVCSVVVCDANIHSECCRSVSQRSPQSALSIISIRVAHSICKSPHLLLERGTATAVGALPAANSCATSCLKDLCLLLHTDTAADLCLLLHTDTTARCARCVAAGDVLGLLVATLVAAAAAGGMHSTGPVLSVPGTVHLAGTPLSSLPSDLSSLRSPLRPPPIETSAYTHVLNKLRVAFSLLAGYQQIARPVISCIPF